MAAPFPINPIKFYRRGKDGPVIFGLSRSQLGEAIRQGKLPLPEKIYEGSHASGWRGQVLIEWFAAREAERAA